MEQHLAHDDEPTRAIDRSTKDLRGYSRRAADGPSGIREGGAFGPYGILRRLGRGGMGTVWEAVHRPSGHRLALKVLNTGFATREDRERFLREGQIAASVSHPRSVYVYGTEEVDGHPVITMELMKGGTLWDALKASGQLSIRQAVDWTLEIVEGLQAAAETGILHRDIKPSNAFLDAGGRAKIGDYGLAWSTGRFALADEEETFAGTPAYASPEQVRGEKLDERSDIYAVGATLYQLLTGRMPIEADTLSGTLKAVLEALPVPPGRLRKGIPKGLERVVLGCLEKDRTRRPPSYTALTAALKPFSSQAPEPAPLPSRILAYGLDVLPWFFLESVLERFHPARNTTPLDGLLLLLIPGLVFFASEARYGASPGKRLFGLEVQDTAGDRPGWGAVALRTAVWMALFRFHFVLVLAVGSDWQDRHGPAGSLMDTLAMAALFVPMRRGNGYRGLHEWLSGTRVVARRPLEGEQRHEAAIPSVASGEAGRIGPYLLKERLRGGALWLGWDPALAREVWILELPPGTAPLSEARRAASRVGSLHWMHGSREGESWDAFESVPGRSLADHARVGAPWEACRAWMLDLAEEAAARVAEGEPPGLFSGARVWVGEDGHARLADFPVPSEADAPAFQEAQAFFAWMATVLHRESWPLHAMELAADLEAGHLPALGTLAARLRGLQAKPARMTWRRRLAHLSAGLALPAMFLLLGVSRLPIPDHRPEDVLLAAVALLEQVERGAVDPRILGRAGDLERVALYEYRRLKRGPAETGSLNQRARRIYLEGAAYAAVPRRLEPLDRSLPPLSLEDRNRSYAAVAAPMDEALALSAGKLGQVFAGALSLMALLGLLSSLACRGGLGFRMMGMAVVDRGGRAVSPWRGLLRGAAAWSPWMVALAFLVLRDANLPKAASRAVLALDFFGHGLSWAALALLAAGAGYALRHPGRGLQDRLAGTWIVPR